LEIRWRQVGFIGFIEFVEFIEFIELIETGDWRLETREQAQMTKLKCQTKLKIQMTNQKARDWRWFDG